MLSPVFADWGFSAISIILLSCSRLLSCRKRFARLALKPPRSESDEQRTSCRLSRHSKAARMPFMSLATRSCSRTGFEVGARLPTIYGGREYVTTGGLMSYGPNYPDLYKRAADYVDKILRGAKPGDVPVAQPTKFDLIINLTTAKALGLDLPPSMLARADEVIE